MSKPAPKGKIKGSNSTALAVLDPIRDPDPIRQTCRAHAKHSGKPCRYPAIPGGTVCRFHGGGAPQVQFKALERLAALQPKAVGSLETLMDMVREFPSTAYAASRDVLDRTLGKAAEVQQVDAHVEVQISWQK